MPQITGSASALQYQFGAWKATETQASLDLLGQYAMQRYGFINNSVGSPPCYVSHMLKLGLTQHKRLASVVDTTSSRLDINNMNGEMKRR